MPMGLVGTKFRIPISLKKKKKVVQDHFGIEGNKKFMWSQEVESYSLAQLILKAFILVQGLASLNDLFKLKSDWHGD